MIMTKSSSNVVDHITNGNRNIKCKNEHDNKKMRIV